MEVGLNWLLPKPLRSEKLRFESALSPAELMHLMQQEFHRPVHSKQELKLIGEFAADRFKLWSSSHLNEADEGRSLVPSVLMEGTLIRCGAGSFVQVILRPHWSCFFIVIMLLAIAISGLLFRGHDWKSLLSIIPVVLLLLTVRATAQNKSQLRSYFAQCFTLNEVDRPR